MELMSDYKREKSNFSNFCKINWGEIMIMEKIVKFLNFQSFTEMKR